MSSWASWMWDERAVGDFRGEREDVSAVVGVRRPDEGWCIDEMWCRRTASGISFYPEAVLTQRSTSWHRRLWAAQGYFEGLLSLARGRNNRRIPW